MAILTDPQFATAYEISIQAGEVVGVWSLPTLGNPREYRVHVFLNGDANADYRIDGGVMEEGGETMDDVHWFAVATEESVDEVRHEASWVEEFLRIEITAGTGQADTAIIAVDYGRQ